MCPSKFHTWSSPVPCLRQRSPQLHQFALFADDSKLYKSIDLPDSTLHLQNDLDNLHKWSLDWAMKFNKSKYQALRVSRKKTKIVSQYNLDGQPLECVPYVKDLGVTVCSDMSWSRHIEETVAKANRTLGLVKRTCKDTHDQRVRKLLFCALVRPILEYASSLCMVTLYHQT